MKPWLLANENFHAPSSRLLRDRGCDVAGVADDGRSLADPEVLALEVAEKGWIVTFDRDYGELIFARGLTARPAVILFRMRSYRSDDPGWVLADLLDAGSEFEGHFVRVEEAGLRKRPLPELKSARG